MAFVQVVPVHLVNPNGEHFFILLVDSFLDDVVIEELVYVNSGGVPEVKDERMSEWFGPDIICPVVTEKFEELLIDCISIKEIFANCSLQLGMPLNKDSLAAQLMWNCACLQEIKHGSVEIFYNPNCTIGKFKGEFRPAKALNSYKE